MSAKHFCPVKGVCLNPSQCADFHGCILQPAAAAPLILTPMSDWRANPTPYPLRKDDKSRAIYPQGLTHA